MPPLSGEGFQHTQQSNQLKLLSQREVQKVVTENAVTIFLLIKGMCLSSQVDGNVKTYILNAPILKLFYQLFLRSTKFGDIICSWFLNQHLQFSAKSEELTSASESSHTQLLTASSLSTFISMETEQGKVVFLISVLILIFIHPTT